jgi:hypothetical protein
MMMRKAEALMSKMSESLESRLGDEGDLPAEGDVVSRYSLDLVQIFRFWTLPFRIERKHMGKSGL